MKTDREDRHGQAGRPPRQLEDQRHADHADYDVAGGEERAGAELQPFQLDRDVDRAGDAGDDADPVDQGHAVAAIAAHHREEREADRRSPRDVHGAEQQRIERIEVEDDQVEES